MCRDNGFSIFLLGGASGVAERAAAALSTRFPGLKIAGCYSPPLADVVAMNHAEILARIEAANPDLLLIAFGAPKQEKWANMHVRQWKVPLAIGVGGTLDFLAGAQRRAPRVFQKLGLEWVWRVGTNPKRLFRRYAKNLVFFFSAIGKLLALKHGFPRLEKTAPPTFQGLEKLATAAHFERWLGLLDATAARAWLEKIETAAGRNALVLDMSATQWLSSLELGFLLALNQARRASGTRLLLIKITPRVRRLLTVCRLERYLELVDSTAELEKLLQEWRAAQQETLVWGDAPHRLVFRLPDELTAANLPTVRAEWEAFWSAAGSAEALEELVVDISATKFLDSSALGFLVALKKTIEQRGLRWRCFAAQPAVQQIMKIAYLERLLLVP
jgi:N-acetylglucosaminyldiphosphoundecaprenol N-acetyl-beta-D-mannosaminyltransferase